MFPSKTKQTLEVVAKMCDYYHYHKRLYKYKLSKRSVHADADACQFSFVFTTG